ncbi:hypothetical protein [Vibrio phage vB_VhaS-tm]|nr:hypothetical protein [Vibrio phage vB_VhaS-tm]
MAINKISNGMKGLAVRTILNQVIDEVNNLTTLKPTPKFTLNAQTIANAVDNGVFKGVGSVKTLSEGWWVIPGDNVAISGKPPGAQGDLIYFSQDVGNGKQYAYGFALGKDKQGVDTMWVQYRDGSQWTAWWPIQNLKQLKPSGQPPTTIQQDIANLKQGQQNAIERIKLLETRLGGIFAPNQASFDRAVAGLIQPEVTQLEKKIADNTKEIESLENTALTLDQVTTHLKALGWGPLDPNKHKPGLGEPVEFTAIYGSNFPTTVGALQGADKAFTVSRSSTAAARIFVIVKDDKEQADRVVGITIDDGMRAHWDHRDMTIQGTKYRVFYSPSAFYEQSNKVQVNIV